MSWDVADWDVDLRDTIRRYIALRKAHPALRRGEFVPLYASDRENVYAFLRRWEQDVLVVVLNNGVCPYEMHVPVDGELSDGTALEDGLGTGRCTVSRGYVNGVRVPPLSGVVLWSLG